MKLMERSYSSKIFRPKPHLHVESDGGLLIVATSWGRPEHAALVSDEIAKYVTAARGDVEVTSPFEFVPTLSDQANSLRIATLIANDILYRGENRSEYVSGVEVLTLSLTGTQLSWAQVGAPHVLVRKAGQSPVPLATSFDHSFDAPTPGLPPLPSSLLGVDPGCHIVCGDVLVTAGDSLILLASSLLPTSLWTAPGPFDLQNVTSHLVQAQPESPFWLGLVELGADS